MKMKIKKELKAFKQFKENFKFEMKEIVEKDNSLYCDGVLLKDENENYCGDSEKWINVGYKFHGSYAQMLSNLFPYKIKFRGKKLSSLECFFQGIKFKDKKTQNYIFTYFGIQAVHIKTATNYDWKETGIIYWQGKAIDRFSKEYNNLIDELYICAIQNPLYRGVLLNCEKPIIHAIGEIEKVTTTFTRYEFEFELNCLKAFLQSKTIK